MNNERLSALFTYLDGLANLAASDYRCNTEINECIGWIKAEFTKEMDDTVSVEYDAIGMPIKYHEVKRND